MNCLKLDSFSKAHVPGDYMSGTRLNLTTLHCGSSVITVKLTFSPFEVLLLAAQIVLLKAHRYVELGWKELAVLTRSLVDIGRTS